MSATATRTYPVVDADGVTFRLDDPERRLRGVQLSQHVRIAGDNVGFRYYRNGWTLRIDRPAVDRMEYLLELEQPGGRRETILDPANPNRVPGAFGEKSVVEFPSYQSPRWLLDPLEPATLSELSISSPHLGGAVRGALWAPEDLSPSEPAPLLIVHDGPEFDRLGLITHYFGALVRSRELPPLRAALLAPGDRNRWYGANPAYARALAADVLPTLQTLAPATFRVGIGASLGALAMLHLHRSCPDLLSGLFLQSGSFFRPELDPQESGFSRYRPVTRFVGDVVTAVADPRPVPTSLTCGAIEENLDNNRLMTTALQRLGYPAVLHEVPDAHNYTAWRDTLHPHLTTLVAAVNE
jgi:enterochelin esterase-like enzyme